MGMIDLERGQTATQWADADSPVDASTLLGLARGTAYVKSVTFYGDETLVRLLYPAGREAEISVPTMPGPNDFGYPPELRRLLAVQVHRKPTGVQCSVLGTSHTGPKRVPISMRQALALAWSGVHTVFRSE